MARERSSSPSPVETCLRQVMEPADSLYAVLDAAQDTELAFAARDRFELEPRTLFVGDLAQRLYHVAPHLIPLQEDSALLQLWSEHLGRSAGLLLLAPAEPDALWGHLRDLFMVVDEEGDEFAFRYYDPRVLRPYLLTCTGDEAAEFFGPIRCILVEADRPGVMLCCEPGANGVRITEIAPRGQTPAAPSGEASR